MKGIKRGIYFCWQKKYIVYSSGVSCCSYCCCVLLPVTELCCVGGNVRLWIGSVRKSVCYSDFSYSLGLALMLSLQNVHFWDLAGNFRHLFLPWRILLSKFTPGILFVCEREILQRSIFKLKWATLTLSSHRAGSVSWRTWKFLDVVPRELWISPYSSPSTTLPKFSDGATEEHCLKCASTLRSQKVKAASAHFSQVLAAGTQN